MAENEMINGWTFEETVKTAENLMESEQNMFKWDVLRHLRDFAENYREELGQYWAIGTPEECLRNKDFLDFLADKMNPNDFETYLRLYNGREKDLYTAVS